MNKERSKPAANRGLGRFIESERKERRWTYDQLADAAGISKVQAWGIAHGNIAQPTMTTLGKLAVAFSRNPIAAQALTTEQYLAAILAAGNIGAGDDRADQAELGRIIHLMRTSPEAPILIGVLEQMTPDLRRRLLNVASALLAETEAGDQTLRKR